VVCKACGQELPARLYRDDIEDMKEKMISHLFEEIPSPTKTIELQKK
jgi:hypothetical protein